LLMRVVCPVLGNVAVHNPVNVALVLSIAGMFMLAAVASAASVSVAVGRSGVGERPYRFALYPAALAALAMVVVSVPRRFGDSRCGRRPPRCSLEAIASSPPPRQRAG
jgi:CBS-domain-containing membrane protein